MSNFRKKNRIFTKEPAYKTPTVQFRLKDMLGTMSNSSVLGRSSPSVFQNGLSPKTSYYFRRRRFIFP